MIGALLAYRMKQADAVDPDIDLSPRGGQGGLAGLVGIGGTVTVQPTGVAWTLQLALETGVSLLVTQGQSSITVTDPTATIVGDYIGGPLPVTLTASGSGTVSYKLI